MKQQKSPKRRTQVKELPKEVKQLSKDEQEQVKGGLGTSLLIDLSAKPKL
ncbi:MAG TPA: hypothetical protein VGV38_15755 [Pyrinomonadaceae bacterium]|nr:hypothetical protein [Pyrinomonadaceae bacterium]